MDEYEVILSSVNQCANRTNFASYDDIRFDYALHKTNDTNSLFHFCNPSYSNTAIVTEIYILCLTS